MQSAQEEQHDLEVKQSMFSLSELQAREPPNKIIELKPQMKNLDLKVIVIEKG